MVGEHLEVIALDERREGLAAALVSPPAVDREVDGHARQPRPGVRRAVPARRRLEHLHERLLHDVERVLALTQVAEGDPVEPALVALDERRESLPVAACQACHEFAVISSTSPRPPSAASPSRAFCSLGRVIGTRGAAFSPSDLPNARASPGPGRPPALPSRQGRPIIQKPIEGEDLAGTAERIPHRRTPGASSASWRSSSRASRRSRRSRAP